MKYCIGFVTESNSKNRHLSTWHISLNTVFLLITSAAKNEFIRLEIETFQNIKEILHKMPDLKI